MNDYKELIGQLREQCPEKDYDCCKLAFRAADAIEQLVKERDAAVADLEKCMHYAKPKNNNVCDFCKKNMSENQDKCDGWSDFCECEPEWRGVPEECDEFD